MAEETIAFVLVFVPLVKKMGYDNITGVAVVFVASGLGFAGAILNPFTIGIAQGISELPLFSGLEYRVLCWIIITSAGAFHILRHTKKVKIDAPKPSEDLELTSNDDTTQQSLRVKILVLSGISIGLLMFAIFNPVTDISFGNTLFQIPTIPVLTGLFILISAFLFRRKVQYIVLHLLTFTILFLVRGVLGYKWYIMEIASLFLVLGIACGIACSFSANKITDYFVEGMRDILPAAVMVGMAGGVITMLEDGQVIDTILSI